jgi:hypothetical protein
VTQLPDHVPLTSTVSAAAGQAASIARIKNIDSVAAFMEPPFVRLKVEPSFGCRLDDAQVL